MAAAQPSLASARVPLPQFIIALLLVKSKPVSISTQEYLAQLRTLIRKEKRSKYSSFTHSHLDTAAYQQNVQNEAQKTIFELQAQIAQLEGKTKAYPTFKDLAPEYQDQIPTFSPGKRKRKVSDPGTRPKRIARHARVANSSTPLQSHYNQNAKRRSQTYQNLEPGAGARDLRGGNETFLQKVFILQQITSYPNPKPSLIASCLEQIFHLVQQNACMIELHDDPLEISPVHHSTLNNYHHEFDHPLSIQRKTAKLLPLLLQAMDHLGQDVNVQNMVGSLIYRFVKTYEEMLLHVCKLSKSFGITPQQNISSRSGATKLKSGQTQDPTEMPQRQSGTLLDLCELAIAMTTTLDSNKHAQRLMLEGCLSVLLKMIGTGLKTCVFGQPSDISINDKTRDDNSNQDEVADLALEAKSPYLVYIVRRVKNSMNVYSLQHPSNALLALAKERFQNSMLNSVFGESALGLLKPSLDTPEPPEDSQQLVGIEGIKVEDWYKSEVWKLVGWDVLDDYLKQPLQGLKTAKSS